MSIFSRYDYFLKFKILFIYLGWTGSVLQHADSSLQCADSVACGVIVPWLRLEPAAPALEGGFLTARPPGKSFNFIIEHSKATE